LNDAKSGVVLYGIGSPIVGDIEESLLRAGVPVRGAIRNWAGECFLGDASVIVDGVIDEELLASPFLVPLFTPGNRQQAAREAADRGFRSPYCLIDPASAAPRSLRGAPGLYINAGCSLGAAIEFGPFAFVNRGASVGHHFRCEPFVSIGPGAVIAGQVSVGRGACIGAGAVVLPRVAIGANAVIAAGAVVTRDVPDHCLAAGNPARVVKEVPGYNGRTVDQHP
jgi:hypothetical protein